MSNERFLLLVSNWLDGSLSEAESRELQAELEDVSTRRDQFADLCRLDADLRLMSDLEGFDLQRNIFASNSSRASTAETVRLANPEEPDAQDFPNTESHANTWTKGPSAISRGRLLIASGVAAAILLTIGYGIGRDFGGRSIVEVTQSDRPPIESSPDSISENVSDVSGCALLSRIVNAKFADGVSHREGDTLSAGELKLISGAVQIDFFSGATMLMDEATEVNLVSAWEAKCVKGKVMMHVPPPAIGFRLLLPGMEVVDLGTEFGAEVEGSDATLHVFDGEVEAHVPGSEMQIIRQGEGLQSMEGKTFASTPSKPGNFLSAQEFQDRSGAFYERLTGRWWSSLKPVRSDRRMIGCYLFKQWDDDRWDRLVNNFAIPKVVSRSGSAVGTRWVEGRWPTKSAMEFKSPGDRVRISLGDEKYDGLTMASWIRIDRLKKFNALMFADGYENGEPHWQIDQSGRLAFSLSFWRSQELDGTPANDYRDSHVFRSPPVLQAGGRRWHHVAVTYDAATGEAVQYFDGAEISREMKKPPQFAGKVTFGRCEIGNWKPPLKSMPFNMRNFNGRMDEFLVYGAPLNRVEIEDLYQRGNATRH